VSSFDFDQDHATQEARLKAGACEIVRKEKGEGDAVGERTGSITGQGTEAAE